MADYAEQRRMLVGDLERMGHIKSPEVRAAMLKVRREMFVDPDYKSSAYADVALPIIGGSTISQPLIYAQMLESLSLKMGEKVLEIGSGSGYGSALIFEIVGSAGRVISMEIQPEVCEYAKANLSRNGYDGVEVVCADGSEGYPKEAPFDAMMVTAAPKELPSSLVDQLKVGGRMVAPVGDRYAQELVYMKKGKDGKVVRKSLGGVIFLPMVGKVESNV